MAGNGRHFGLRWWRTRPPVLSNRSSLVVQRLPTLPGGGRDWIGGVKPPFRKVGCRRARSLLGSIGRRSVRVTRDPEVGTLKPPPVKGQSVSAADAETSSIQLLRDGIVSGFFRVVDMKHQRARCSPASDLRPRGLSGRGHNLRQLRPRPGNSASSGPAPVLMVSSKRRFASSTYTGLSSIPMYRRPC